MTRFAALTKKFICLIGVTLRPFIATAKEKKGETSVPDASLADVRWAEVVNGVPFDKAALTEKVVVVEQWGVNCPPSESASLTQKT